MVHNTKCVQQLLDVQSLRIGVFLTALFRLIPVLSTANMSAMSKSWMYSHDTVYKILCLARFQSFAFRLLSAWLLKWSRWIRVCLKSTLIAVVEAINTFSSPLQFWGGEARTLYFIFFLYDRTHRFWQCCTRSSPPPCDCLWPEWLLAGCCRRPYASTAARWSGRPSTRRRRNPVPRPRGWTRWRRRPGRNQKREVWAEQTSN